MCTMRDMEINTCVATKLTPTAGGDITVQCGKAPDHVAAGDPQHEAKVGVFPVRWVSAPAGTAPPAE